MKPMYIAQLEETTQNAIEKALTRKLRHVGITGMELAEAIERGMDSKISDVAYLIDIDKIIKRSGEQ